MTLRLILSFLLPLATGWILVGALATGVPADWRGRVLRAALATGLGLGLASAGFFVVLLLAAPSRGAVLTVDLALLLGALALRRLHPVSARPGRAHHQPTAAGAMPAWVWLLRASGALGFGMALAGTSLLVTLQPHGAWDAWAIWNMRARFLYRGGAEWRDGLSPLVAWTHPDYPLLLPGLVARAWWYAGRDTVEAPWVIAGAFTAATVALALAAVAMLRGEAQGWLAALVLVGAPQFLHQATNLMADVPLAFFYLAALVGLGLGDRPGDLGGRPAALAGLAIGLAAWTKNEGLAGTLAVLLAWLAVGVRGGAGRRRLWLDLAPMAAGLVPMLLLVGYFKLRLAPSSEYLSLAGLARFADAGRYATIAEVFFREVTGFAAGPVSAVVVLLGYGLAMGMRVAPAGRRLASSASLAVVLTGAAYVGVYLITPHPLAWQMATSLPRLIVQLWPASVFAYFLLVTPPEQVAPRSEEGPAGIA